MPHSAFAVQGTVTSRKDRTFGESNTPVIDLVIAYKQGTSQAGRDYTLSAQVECLRDAVEQAMQVSVGDLVSVSGEVSSRETTTRDGQTFWRTSARAQTVVVLRRAQQPQQYAPAPQYAPQQPQAAQHAPQQPAAPTAPQYAPQAPAPAPQQAQPALYDQDIPF